MTAVGAGALLFKGANKTKQEILPEKGQRDQCNFVRKDLNSSSTNVQMEMNGVTQIRGIYSFTYGSHAYKDVTADNLTIKYNKGDYGVLFNDINGIILCNTSQDFLKTIFPTIEGKNRIFPVVRIDRNQYNNLGNSFFQ